MVGTTHFTNAFIERRGLEEVGVIRIALPATRAIPPLTDWPSEIVTSIGKHCYLVQGGYQYDGRLNAPLDEMAIVKAARDIRSKGLRSVAITGLFSPVLATMEERAEEIVRNELPDTNITLSSRIGRMGLLERENAAIINASLSHLASNILGSFRNAFNRLNISSPIYISQNDGTLMSESFSEKYPVLTFSSGPTNSLRGAVYLSGIEDAVVVDIGGTTTDVGRLVKGFPTESALAVNIGGVRTNFRMPDLLSIGLGGGSLVQSDDAGEVSVGPASVGYRLLREARAFGGDRLTATDIAVAAGYASIGDASLLHNLSSEFVENAVCEIHRLVSEAVDRMKISATPIPLVLVGGGAILIDRDIPGTCDVIVPEHASIANAIGAAIAQVGGEIDRVFSYEGLGRDAAISVAKNEAIDTALEAGALADTVEITEIDEIPLAYVPGGSVRLRVKAVGDLSFERLE